MKRFRGIAIAFAVAAAFGLPAQAAGDAHSHDHAGEAKLVLNHGKKWQTDAPLRQGMENIRAAVAKDLKVIHANKATPAQYEALAKKVNTEVAGIVQNCKLDPEADAQLHIVIAELMAAAEVMEGKAKGEKPREGAVKAVKALNAYGKHFDHAGWKRL
jgi:hypothetical protein